MLARLLKSQGSGMSKFCPQWVYTACIGLVVNDFIKKDIPLDLISIKYARELSEKYDEVNPVQMASISEDIVRVLSEVEAGSEAVVYISGFIYFTVNFESLGKARTRKKFLGSIFDGEKELNYDERSIVKSFKSYMFSLRSGAAPTAPSGWSLDQEDDIDFLKEIALKEFSIFDALQTDS